MPGRRALHRRVHREAVLGLGNAHRQVAKPQALVFLQLSFGDRCELHASGMVDTGSNGANLFRQGQAVFIEEFHLRFALIHLVQHRLGQLSGAFTTGCPVIRGHCPHAQLLADGLDQRHLLLSVIRETVDAHHRGQAKLLQIADMPLKVGRPFSQRRQVGNPQLAAGNTALHFESPNGADHYGGIRAQSRVPALDINELFRAQIGTKARLGNHHVVQGQRSPGCGDGIAPVGDIGKGPTMNKHRIVLQALHQVWLQGFFQQYGE